MKRSRIMTWCVVFMLPLLCGADTATLLEDRLRELVPDNPGAYIELAEVVADDINSDADRRLSIRLFAIAVTLDPVRWSRSGMLGILELLEDEEQIRRLQSMVAMQDGGGGGMLPRRRVALGYRTRLRSQRLMCCRRSAPGTTTRAGPCFATCGGRASCSNPTMMRCREACVDCWPGCRRPRTDSAMH